MALELEGKLHKKFNVEQISNTFKKREFVIETEEQYPQMVKFELTQDRCGLIDNYNEGDKLKVHFNVRGREWNGKYFNNLNAWRVDVISNQNQPQNGSNDFPPMEDAPPVEENNTLDDLPF